jgi:hypothetical protein
VVAVAGAFLWAAVTTVGSTNAVTYDWFAGGLGLVVLGYGAVGAMVGIALMRGASRRWMIWFEYATAIVLGLVGLVSLSGLGGGGAAVFYVLLSALAAAAAALAILVAREIGQVAGPSDVERAVR